MMIKSAPKVAPTQVPAHSSRAGTVQQAVAMAITGAHALLHRGQPQELRADPRDAFG